jgi:hypothetical protein
MKSFWLSFHIGCARVISFAYLSRDTPEPSRAHRSRTMPRPIGSIASHDASMLDRLALRSPSHPRLHLALLPRWCAPLARTLPQCLNASRSSEARCHAIKPGDMASWLASVARDCERVRGAMRCKPCESSDSNNPPCCRGIKIFSDTPFWVPSRSAGRGPHR